MKLVLSSYLLDYSKIMLIFAAEFISIGFMTTFALNNLWTYLQGLALSQGDREWLANKLVMPKEATPELAMEERKARFLRLAGSWSDAEGEEYYQMMKHRNKERPANRVVNFAD